MHDEMEDMLERANEIQESLGRSYAVPDELDEDDLEAGKFRTLLPHQQRSHYFFSRTGCIAVRGRGGRNIVSC